MLRGLTNGEHQSLDSSTDLSPCKTHTLPILPDFLSEGTVGRCICSEKASNSYQSTVRQVGLMAYSC